MVGSQAILLWCRPGPDAFGAIQTLRAPQEVHAQPERYLLSKWAKGHHTLRSEYSTTPSETEVFVTYPERLETRPIRDVAPMQSIGEIFPAWPGCWRLQTRNRAPSEACAARRVARLDGAGCRRVGSARRRDLDSVNSLKNQDIACFISV